MSNDAHPVNIKIEDGKFPDDKEWFLMCGRLQENAFGERFGWEIKDKISPVNGSKSSKIVKI